jgi:hypothetical protein
MGVEQSERNGDFWVGTARRLITPTVKGRRVYVAGHRAGRQATGIHDELWARALAMRYRDVTVALVALDLLGLVREDVLLIRELAAEQGLPAEGLIVTCTGNHAGPDTSGLWSRRLLGGGLNTRYVEFLRAEVVQVARLAAAAMEPAKAYLARAEVPGLASDGESRELSLLQLASVSENALATVVNLALVPQVVDEANTLIGADFPGWLCLDLERTGGGLVLYVCAEASEEVLPAVAERSWEEAERLGYQLAAAVRDALEGALPAEIDRLEIWKRPVVLAPHPTAEEGSQPGGFPKRHIESEVSLIQLGPARIAVLPGLVAPELGFEIRKMLDAPYRFIFCMGNDSLGAITMPGSALSVPEARHSAGRASPGLPSLPHTGTILLDQVANLMVEARRVDDRS